MPEVTTLLAEVRDYDGLLEALRARRDALDISHECIDAVSGVQSGYTSKLLCKPPIKGLGRMSLGALLGALGLKLLVVEDVEQLERVRPRLVPRYTSMTRPGQLLRQRTAVTAATSAAPDSRRSAP
jgi:hypothetical protein